MPTLIGFQVIIWASCYAALRAIGPMALLATMVFWSAITATVRKPTLLVYQLVNLCCIFWFLGDGIVPALSQGWGNSFWSAAGFVLSLLSYGVLAVLVLASIAVLAGRVDCKNINQDPEGNTLHLRRPASAWKTCRSGGRVYLHVPYQEKDWARLLGARYDGACKRWYSFDDGSGDHNELVRRWG